MLVSTRSRSGDQPSSLCLSPSFSSFLSFLLSFTLLPTWRTPQRTRDRSASQARRSCRGICMRGRCRRNAGNGTERRRRVRMAEVRKRRTEEEEKKSETSRRGRNGSFGMCFSSSLSPSRPTGPASLRFSMIFFFFFHSVLDSLFPVERDTSHHEE